MRVYEPEYEDGRWTGKRISGTGKTLAEAKQNLSKNRRRRAEGLNKRRVAVPTLGEWVEQWAKTVEVRPETRRNYTNALRHTEALNSTRLDELTPATLRAHFTETIPQAGKLGQGATRNVYTVLNLALNAAVENEHLTGNPLARVRAPKKQTQSEDHEMLQARWIPREIVRRIGETDESLPWWLTFMGLRQAEKLGLTWDSITNLDKKHKATLHIKQTLKWRDGQLQVLPEVKNATSRRSIPIPEVIAEKLRARKKQNQRWRKTEQWNPKPGLSELILNDAVGSPRTQQKDSREWATLLSTLNLPQVRQHANRHFLVSTAIAAGANLQAVKAVAGHAAKSTVTEQIYLQLNDSDRRAVMETISAKLIEKTKTPSRSRGSKS